MPRLFHVFCVGCLLGLINLAHAANGVADTSHGAAHYSLSQHYPISGDGGWDYLTYDPVGTRLFITRGDRVQVINPDTGREMAEIPGLHGVHGVALAQDLQLGFISNGGSNSVTVIELGSLKVRSDIKVTGVGPDAILYVPQRQRVYTFNGGSNDITVIDANSLEVVDTILLDGRPEFAASDGRSIFVNLVDRGRIAVIDVQTNQVLRQIDLAPCEEPSGLALDAEHGHLFSVCSNNKMMVVDAATGRMLAELPIGRNPDAVVYDAATGFAFTSCGQGTLSIAHRGDGDHYAIVRTIATRKGARTLALNPVSHAVYLVSADPEAPAASAAPGNPPAEQHPRHYAPGTFGVLVVSP